MLEQESDQWLAQQDQAEGGRKSQEHHAPQGGSQ